MSNQVIIISPDEGLARELVEAIRSVSPGGEPIVLSKYPTPGDLRNLLRSSEASFTAVIVDLGIPEQGLELVRAVSEGFPDIPAMAADVASKAESILGAMRAGAAEYLIPPFDTQLLRDTLQRRARKQRASRPKGKLVCFMPAQGGNGASTLALHAANAISRESDGKVLLIDFDFHSGTVAFRLRLKPSVSICLPCSNLTRRTKWAVSFWHIRGSTRAGRTAFYR